METKKACEETGKSYLEDAKEATLKQQFEGILNQENSVYNLISECISRYSLHQLLPYNFIYFMIMF